MHRALVNVCDRIDLANRALHAFPESVDTVENAGVVRVEAVDNCRIHIAALAPESLSSGLLDWGGPLRNCLKCAGYRLNTTVCRSRLSLGGARQFWRLIARMNALCLGDAFHICRSASRTFPQRLVGEQMDTPASSSGIPPTLAERVSTVSTVWKALWTRRKPLRGEGRTSVRGLGKCWSAY
jgi:hypothetical protein